MNVAPVSMDQVGILARVLARATAAGLLSLAFMFDQLASSEIDLGEFFGDDAATQSLSAVVLLAFGVSGLFAVALLAVTDSNASSTGNGGRLHRWRR